MSVREHDLEPLPGLPEQLPDGETLLWQGAPRWRPLAMRAFHLRGLAVYFALLAAWGAASASMGGGGAAGAALDALRVLAIGLVPIGLLGLMAFLAGRTSVYTITSRRIVLRVGVALPTTINLPFAAIRGALLARHADGTGDIVLSLEPQARVSYVALWPHVRQWRLSRPEPVLRALADAGVAAQVLSRALAASAGQAVAPLAELASPAREPGGAAGATSRPAAAG